MDYQPLVSIMMPAYNVGQYIFDAIKSIKDQTYENWELCIVDDGSTDLTFEMAHACSCEDDRIRVKTIEHSGCPTARNVCFEMMRGSIVARQDADDYCSPTRIEKQVKWLLEHPDYHIVTCRFNWSKQGVTLPQKAEGMHPEKYLKGIGGRPANATIVSRYLVYKIVGPFSKNQLAGSDGDWNFRAIRDGFRWGYIPEYLYTQRRHPNQLSVKLRNEQSKVHKEALKKYGKKK